MTLWDFTRQLINTQLIPYSHKITVAEYDNVIFDGVASDIYYDEDNTVGLKNRWSNDIKKVYAIGDTIIIIIKDY